MDNWNEEAESELISLISLIQEVNKRGSWHNITTIVCVWLKRLERAWLYSVRMCVNVPYYF